MLTKEEKKQRNTDFWSSFKKRMNKIKSSDGRQMSWLSYRTNVKDVYVRLIAEKEVLFCFDIQPKDDGIRSILWEQMTEMKVVMENEMGQATFWNEFSHQTGNQMVSRICWRAEDLNFNKIEQHLAIEEFFEEKLKSFDRFYQEYKEILITLAE